MKQKNPHLSKTFIALTTYTLIIVLMLLTTGCAVYMAATAPGKKDLSVLNPGTNRGLVIAELGVPVMSEEKSENKDRTDIFSFKQGYSAAVKAGRAFFHLAADFFTLLLWEIVGTPSEIAFRGSEMKAQVTYDENDNVKSSQIIGK